MAPEIALKEPYDKEADVFSFSMLLWEITSMEFLFPGYTVRDYLVRVVMHNERPTIPKNKNWHPVIKTIVQEGWDRKPQSRPSMKRISMMIRGLLQDMFNDDSIMHRSTHMMDKSHRSLHNTLAQEKGNVHPMMMENGSVIRRPGGTHMDIPTTNSLVKSMTTNTRKETFHQNFDESEIE
jgi:hypothetical protein